jgi:predicted nucleic acid-binding Zn ribbon protein
MAFSVAKICTDYCASLFINDNQRLHRMTFFLAGVIFFLFIFAVFYWLLVTLSVFLGRSIGVSEGSI